MKITIKGDEGKELFIDRDGLDTFDYVSLTIHEKGGISFIDVSLDKLFSAIIAFESERSRYDERNKKYENE